MIDTAITNLSSKGQIVIPNKIRKIMHLSIGSKFFIITDGSNLILKPMIEPKLKTFERLIAISEDFVKREKIKKSDLIKSIKKVRNENRNIS